MHGNSFPHDASGYCIVLLSKYGGNKDIQLRSKSLVKGRETLGRLGTRCVHNLYTAKSNPVYLSLNAADGDQNASTEVVREDNNETIPISHHDVDDNGYDDDDIDDGDDGDDNIDDVDDNDDDCNNYNDAAVAAPDK